MTSTPKQVNSVPSSTNGLLGKRKKSHSSKGSYLSKWLDKTMRHIQESAANMDSYDSFINPNLNWPMSNSQIGVGHEPHRHNMYGYIPEPTSLPTPSMYYNPHTHPAYNPGYRCVHQAKPDQTRRSRHKKRNETKAEEMSSAPMENVENILSHTGYMQPRHATENQEFASLPPLVTSIGDTNSTSDLNNTEKDDGNNARRYSDPCVRGLPDVARPANGDVESVSDNSSDFSDNEVGGRLLTCLLDQITSLKSANEKLNKELLDTRGKSFLINYVVCSFL